MKRISYLGGGASILVSMLKWVMLGWALLVCGAAAAATGPVVKINSPLDNAILTSASVDVVGTATAVGGGQGIDLMVVIDDTGSLSTSDPTKQRFVALQALLNSLTQGADVRIGLVFFSNTAKLEVALGNITDATKAINAAIAAHSTPYGTTAIGSGIKTATSELSTNGRSSASKVMLVFTDGEENEGSDPVGEAGRAKTAGITVNVVQLGASSATNTQVAQAGGGQVFLASNAQELTNLFTSAKMVNIASVAVTNTTTGKAADSVALSAGAYSAKVDLAVGRNVISVTAVDTSGLSATQTVTVTQQQAATVATLTSLVVSGASSVSVGGSSTYTAKAVYSDGSTKVVSPTWSATGSGASMSSGGLLTATATLSADAPVTVTAVYTEGGVTKVGNISVMILAGSTSSSTISGCTGTGSNLSAITVSGPSFKSPGDSLQVDYCLKNYNSATMFDVYVAVQLPDGSFLFMQSAGFFGSPSFVVYDGRNAPAAYLKNTLIPDKSGTVLNIPVLPMELPTGTYTFYAIPVLAGKDVFSGFNWIGTIAKGTFNLGR